MAWAASAFRMGALGRGGSADWGLVISKTAIGAFEIQQWLSVCGSFNSVDSAEDDDMVTAFHDIDARAFKVDQATGQDWAVAVPFFVGLVLEFMIPGPGKGFGKFPLVILKDIDGESVALGKRLQASGVVGQADQDQRRVQGNRGKRIYGHPHRLVLGG